MRILLVDEHAIVRDGVRRILDEAFPSLEVGEASSAQEALRQVRAARWNLVVLELALSGRGGLELIEDIRAFRPRLPMLVLTGHAVEPFALRSFRAGASGYVTKASAPRDLVEAVRKVTAGGKYLTPALAEHLATTLFSRDTGRPLHESLSDRELQVLRMLASGLSVKEIAYELKLSEKTVSTYRTRVREKMKMRTSAQLVRYAIRAHLVD